MHTTRVRRTETHNSIVRRRARQIEKKSEPCHHFPFEAKTGQNVYGHTYFIEYVCVCHRAAYQTSIISYTEWYGVWLSVQLKRTKTSRVRNVCLVYLRTHASHKLPPDNSRARAIVHIRMRTRQSRNSLSLFGEMVCMRVTWRTARQVRLSVGRFITI